MIKDRPSKTPLNIKKSKKAKKDSKILMNLKLCKTLYLVSCLFQDWEIYKKDIIRVFKRAYYKSKLAFFFFFFYTINIIQEVIFYMK